MYRPTMLITAPVATRSGYGARSRDVVQSLIMMDQFDIKIFPVPWGTTSQNALVVDDPEDMKIISRLVKNEKEMQQKPDIHIHIVVPNEFIPVGKYNIGITAGLEATVIPQSWIEGMNRMDLILTSSNFSKKVLEASAYTNKKTGQVLKLEKPIEVLFEGVNTKIFKKLSKNSEISEDLEKAMSQIKEKWCFLFVGHWLQGGMGEDRKDVGNLIATFFKTFKNRKDTALILKTSGATTCKIDKEDVLTRLRVIRKAMDIDEKDLPNVYLLHADLYDDEMNELYNHPKVKSHITFTHGEGFGRPLLEASLSEKPIMASNWSGHVDFLNTNNSILFPGGLVEVSEKSFQEGIYVKGQQWFAVNYGAASTAMMRVRKDYKSFVLKARKQSLYNKNKYSFNAMTDLFREILDQKLPVFTETVTASLPEIPKLSLPKLEKVS
jgi:hypothetical protein